MSAAPALHFPEGKQVTLTPMLLCFEGQQLTQGLPRTVTLPRVGMMCPGQKNTGCHRRQFMRESKSHH